MDSIRSYNNTKCDLTMARSRLNVLLTEKEHLYTKYFPMTSKLTDIPKSNSQNNDKMAQYLSALTKINPITGMSLDDEIEHERNLIGKLEYYIKTMEKCLDEYTGIEQELYKEIVVNKVNISKAIENVAEHNNKDPRTIWDNYYPNIKKEIKKLKKVQ